MKRIVFTLMMMVGMFSVMAQQTTVQPAANTSKSKIEFKDKSKDFGDIVQGDKVKHDFKFKNTGTEPLILSHVQTTCGCTATEWPREPIPPGGEATIKATFNSAGKMGKQNKVITILSNSSAGTERVSIISNVLPKPPVAPKPTPQPANK